jgi:hypothetical protein
MKQETFNQDSESSSGSEIEYCNNGCQQLLQWLFAPAQELSVHSAVATRPVITNIRTYNHMKFISIRRTSELSNLRLETRIRIRRCWICRILMQW